MRPRFYRNPGRFRLSMNVRDLPVGVSIVTHDQGKHDTGTGGYGKLFLALGLSLLVMFPLTMAFVAQ